MGTLSLSPEVHILPCPNCKATINTSMQACPYCATAIDHTAAAASAETFGKLNQSISDASYLKIMATCFFGFLLLVFIPLIGMAGGWGMIFLELAIPFMCARWWFLYRQLVSSDPEFRRARQITIWVSAFAAILLPYRLYAWFG